MLDHGRAKARRKGADLIAVNAGRRRTGVRHRQQRGHDRSTARERSSAQASGSKREVADAVWDAVVKLSLPLAVTTD